MSDVVAPVVSSPTPAANATPAAPAPEPTFDLEIDGQKVSMSHTQARTELQKRAAADKRFKEAADKSAKADDLLRMLDEDPEEAMRKLGKDPEKAFAKFLEKKARLALLTPEQIERTKEQEELAALKAEKTKAEEERKAAANKELDEHNSRALENQLVAAADKYKLDATPEVLEGLCDVAADLLDYGTIPTVDQIAQEYIRREAEHIETKDRKILAKLEGKTLLNYIGKVTLERIKAAMMAADAESLKSIPAPVAKVKPAIAKPIVRDAKGKYVSESSFDKKFGL